MRSLSSYPLGSVADPIWGRLHETANRSHVVIVEKLVECVRPILDRVIETFPTYTLHNSMHADNVLAAMGLLLGSDVQSLSALEAALLILSAHFHDVGMVFSEDERQTVTNDEPYWSEFLRTNPDSFLAMQGNALPPIAEVERYCRWRHADRVFHFLRTLNRELLHWGTFDIGEVLGTLCLSHVRPTGWIGENAVLATNFHADSDLKFLALILRLADILDFDRSRSPESVYSYLGISRRETPREQASDIEWRKHLCSEGFIFPDERPTGYNLGFLAAPDDPAVEDDLRHFLDVIENEFRECGGLLSQCSRRWRGFSLPAGIDRSNITSTGYRFGQYTLTLDKDQVISLFSGENLYVNTPYVFVRELLQNAIDTTRHRVVVERARGRADFLPEPIRIDAWIDHIGCQWVRIDDCGMGMDEAIIRNFLLRVGSSYYTSSQFRADLLRAGADAGMRIRPISRFGIGLLSCFLEGDLIEISTLRLEPSGGQGVPIRLSIRGQHGYYVLQTPYLDASPMPSRLGRDDGYRLNAGTSIAVRFSPAKEAAVFDLDSLLKKWVLVSPVPIVHGEKSVGESAQLAEIPWAPQVSVVLTHQQMQELSDFIGCEVATPLEVELYPFNLTRYSTDPNIRGQMLAAAFRENPEWLNLSNKLGQGHRGGATLTGPYHTSIELAIVIDSATLELEVVGKTRVWETYDEEDPRLEDASDSILLSLGRVGKALMLWRDQARAGNRERDVRIPIPQLTVAIPEAVRRLIAVAGDLYRSDLFWSHNGISIPSKTAGGHAESPHLAFDVIERDGQSPAHWGVLAICDDPRPDLSPARDRIIRTPWAIHSVSSLAFCKAIREVGIDERNRNRGEPHHGQKGRTLGDLLGHVIGKDEALLGNILLDPLIDRKSHWAMEPIIGTDRGFSSLVEIQDLAERRERIELTEVFEGLNPASESQEFLSLCSCTLIQIGLRYSPLVKKKENRTVVSLLAVAGTPLDIAEGEKYFGPLAFLPFGEASPLRIGGRLNRNHRFSCWLIRAAFEMNRHCPGLLRVLRTRLFDWAGSEGERQSIIGDLNSVIRRVRAMGLGVERPPELALSLNDWPE